MLLILSYAKVNPTHILFGSKVHEEAYGRVGHGCMGHLVLAQRNQVGTVPEDGRGR